MRGVIPRPLYALCTFAIAVFMVCTSSCGSGSHSSSTSPPPAAFTISASPAALNLAPGASATSTITITAGNGFSSSVSLAVTGLPSGITASFSPSSTASTSTLTLAASGSTSVGSSAITVTGVALGVTESAALSVGVGCGPPAYSCTAAADAALPAGAQGIVNNPATAPPMGNLAGAGTVVPDPDFKNPWGRCTDAHTDPNAANITFDTNGGGASIVNHFNTSDTIIYVQEHGGLGVPMLFDPVTMQCSRMYAGNPAYASTGGLTISGIGADFSFSNPNWLYVWNSDGGGAKIYKYDFSNYSSSSSPTVTVVADFIADAGAGFTGTPGNCLPSNFVTSFTGHDGPSNDDTIFTATYSTGLQDSGYYVVAWKVGAGCRVYNTSTATVAGDWGPVGAVSVFTGNSTVPDSPTDEFYVHSIFVNLTGAYALIANGSCVTGNSSCISTSGESPYIWEIATASVWKYTDLAGGEYAFGWNDLINRNNSPLGQYVKRPFAALGSPSPVVTNLPSGITAGLIGHPSWLNDNSTDSAPFFDSLDYPLFYNTGFPSAWTNEVIGVFQNGNTLRFGHNFISRSNPQYSTYFGIGSISQSGKFFMQSSDWLGTLGSTSGASTCVWGYDWKAGQTYPSNFQYLAPSTNNWSGPGYVYQPTSCQGACTSGSSEPIWNQTVGGTTQDGTITWTNEGQQNCRGDVFILKMQ